MSDSAGVPNPFLLRARVRELAPALEELAVEYDRVSEPLRSALNAILGAAPNGWAEALFAAGPQLASLDLSDARWGYAGPPDLNSSDRSLGRYTLLVLARHAAAGDRNNFEQWRGCLAAEPGAAAEAVGSLLEFGLTLTTISRRLAHERTVARARELLTTAGVEFSYRALWELGRVGCVLSTVAEDAVRHWTEWDSVPCWGFDGRIAPLGFRSGFLNDVPNESVEVGSDTGGGEGASDEVHRERRQSRRLSAEEHKAVESAVGEFIKNATAAATEAERRRLAKAVTIRGVADTVGRSQGYISERCEVWKKFQAEREKWAPPKKSDMLDRARGQEQFAITRTKRKSTGGSDSAGGSGSGDSNVGGVSSLADTGELSPDEEAAYAELREKFLSDQTVNADRRLAFSNTPPEGQRLILDGYNEELEERRKATRARKPRS